MRNLNRINAKGVTLIELLVALVISTLVIGGIYRLFVAQTKAYTVQDQVVEVQQNIRSAMEILLRDLRMTGYDSDSLTSKISIANPIIVDPVTGDHIVRVSYEYDDTTQCIVEYRLDGNILKRRQITTKEDGSNTDETQDLLEHVETLNFTYGVDTSNPPDGTLDSWVSAGGIGTARVVAVLVDLTANPDQTNPDVKNWVSPRKLTSAVTLRNLCFTK